MDGGFDCWCLRDNLNFSLHFQFVTSYGRWSVHIWHVNSIWINRAFVVARCSRLSSNVRFPLIRQLYCYFKKLPGAASQSMQKMKIKCSFAFSVEEAAVRQRLIWGAALFRVTLQAVLAIRKLCRAAHRKLLQSATIYYVMNMQLNTVLPSHEGRLEKF